MSAKRPEQDFLLARQDRTNSRNGHSQHQRQRQADELHTFWSGLRTYLSSWHERLDTMENDKNADACTAIAISESSSRRLMDVNSNIEVHVSSTHNTNNHMIIHQQFEDLKQELIVLRKHCLTNGVAGSSLGLGTYSHGTTNEEQLNIRILVPDFLPVGDLRLLHAEFSKCFQRWEFVKQSLIPHERFTFAKYREELARRKSLGLPLSTSLEFSSSEEPNRKVREMRSSHDLMKGAYLQDLSNISIRVDRDGKVVDLFTDSSVCTYINTITAESLSLRNLRNCTILM
jgi:hypothetical protein